MNQTSNIPDAAKAVVIYHFPCMDGFASAWAFNQLKESDYGKDNVSYIPDNYPAESANEQELEGYDVYILDFSYPRDALARMCQYANKVILLDHHKTAQADLENWEDKPANLEIIFDMTRSGAKITWEYFAPLDMDSALIEYVSDRDLWKFALANSKAINAVVAQTPYTFEKYKELDDAIYATPVMTYKLGESLMNQHQKFCEEMAESARKLIITTEDGIQHEGLAVNTTYQFASEVGNILAKKSGTYGATYFSDKEGAVKFSLRSIGDYDVSVIAKQCGGGGHKNASGFILHPNETDRSDTIKVWTIGGTEGVMN